MSLRIAILSHDLASNAFGRAHNLGTACRDLGQVTYWGPSSTGRVWGPLAAEPLAVTTLRVRDRPFFRRDAAHASDLLAKHADVVYCVKPLAASYGVARRARRRHGIPLVLDIDDWEIGFLLSGGVRWKILADGVRRVRRIDSYFPTRRLERLAADEPHRTVSNEFLRSRFGGVLVPTGRDPDWLDPARVDGARAKRAHGLGDARVVLFHGTPRPHKGLEELVDAVARIPDRDVVCVLAGAEPDDSYANSLAGRAPGRVRLLGQQPFSKLPEVVAMADVYVVPQRAGPGTVGQVPAKLIDAMAMARPIVATRVGELGRILEGGRARLVEPGSVEALREAIEGLLADPAAARSLGQRARARFLEAYTIQEMTRRLRPVFEAVAGPA